MGRTSERKVDLRMKKNNMLIDIVSIWMQKLSEKTVNRLFSYVTTNNDMTTKRKWECCVKVYEMWPV
jgi:hypothetical protein